MQPVENSVREDMSSIFYTHIYHGRAVTLTVLRVGSDYIGCDLTDHSPDLASEQMCGTLCLPGICTGTSLAFAKGFYFELQPDDDRTHRVDDALVFVALAEYWVDTFGGRA